MIDVDPAHPSPRPSRWRRLAVTGALALGAAGGLLVGVGPAAAEDPQAMPGEIVDTAGVLGSGNDVQDALDGLQRDTGYQLFVAFVDTFDGRDAITWADDTADLSSLGTNDLLLAVAVQDRAYALSADPDLALTDDQLGAIERRIESRLGDDDWSGAVLAAVDGIRDAAGGGTGTGGSGGGVSGWLVLAVVGLVVIGGIWFVASRRSAAGAAADPARLPTAELGKRASAALVALDDAVKTSEQELGFAQAQFGVEATRSFTTVLADATQALGQAFALRQQLDDAQPETEQQARAMMTQILDLCAHADEQLDDQAEEFARLRDLQNRAPQALTETAQRAAEVSSRIAGARATLQTLATTYSAAALATVAKNADQAESLLAAADDSVRQGQAVVETDRAAAVGLVRAAEDAVEQAVRLLDAVDHARDDLAEAGAKVDAGLASIGADVADADRLARDDPSVTAAAQSARQAIGEATAARDGGDQLGALQRLTQAEAALDAALGPARDAADRLERARTQLASTLGQVTSQIRSVSAFIDTRRGAVGAEARTRLAEAARLAQESERTSATDPAAALGQAQQAGQLAVSAQQLAEADVRGWEQQRSSPSGGGLDSMILGGILRGGGGGGGGGGWSGGFSGGGFGGSTRSAPSRSGGGFSVPRSSGARRSSGGSFGGGRSGGGRSGGGRSRGGRF